MNAAGSVAERLLALEAAVAELQRKVEGTAMETVNGGAAQTRKPRKSSALKSDCQRMCCAHTEAADHG